MLAARRHRMRGPRRGHADVLDGVDAGRFPQGGRRGPVDRQRRPRVPRAVDVARRRDRGAIPLDGRGRRRTARSGPAPATRAQVLKIGKDGKVSTFFDATELEVHALAPAPNGGLYVGDIARRQDLPGEPPTARRRPSSIPKTSTSGRSPLDRAGNLFAAPATRASSTRSRPTARARASTRRAPTNVVSLAFSTSWRSDRRHRIARARVPNRRHRQGVRAPRFAVQGNPRAPAGRRRDDLCRRGERLDIGDRRSFDRSPPAPIPARAPVPTVSTEITAIAVVDAGASQATTPVDLRSVEAEQPRGDLSHPARTACGTRTGRPARIRRTICWSSRRQPARRHRHRRQDLPRQRRSRARHAPRARDRAAGHGPPSRAVRPHRRRHQQSRESSSRSPRARRPSGHYESDVRDAGTVASWGVIRWRATARRRSSRAPDAYGQYGESPTRRGARGRSPTRARTASRLASPNARYLQWRAVLSRRAVRRPGPDVGDGRLSAAQSPARGHARSPCIRPGRSSSVRSPPANWRSRASRRTRRTAARPRRRSPARAALLRCRRALGRRIYQKGLQTIRLEGGGRQRRPAAVRRLTAAKARRRGSRSNEASGTRSSCGTRRRCPTARMS